MTAYILRRLGRALLVMWLAYTLTFIAIQLLPSDGIELYLADLGVTSPDVIEMIRAYYGYNEPVINQYFIQLGGLVRGEFGFSIATGQSVVAEIGTVIGSTAMLAVAAFALTALLVGTLVVTAAVTPHPWLREWLRDLPPFLGSLPTFWLGLLAIQLLSFQLRVMSVFPDGSLISLLVPAAVLAVPLSAPIAQVLLKSIDSISGQPFVSVIRAKGATQSWTFFRHIVKNASGPAVTVLGLLLGSLLTGTIIVETVFGRAGIGRMLQQAVVRQDLALVQGFVLLAALVFVLVNLIVDLLYPLLDPRVIVDRRSPTKARDV